MGRARIGRANNIESMKNSLSNQILRRKSFDEYKKMGKKKLLRSMCSFLAGFDTLRYKYVEIQLQNNYLQRRIQMLEEQLDFYKAQMAKRTFKHGIPKS